MADLQTLRRRRFLTQKELGERIGVTYQTIQTWESGKAQPRLRHIPKLAAELGVPTDELLEIIEGAKIAA